MRIRAWVNAATLTLVLACEAAAHESNSRHIHVNGGLPPFNNVQLTWYQDIAYDDSAELTTLDIYVPEALQGPAPVLVYVHGGGFSGGDKADRAELDPKRGFFTHTMGYVFASVNYRLLPDVRYPDNTQDVANALAWLHDNVAGYGGDPNWIILMGHDVGGVMAAQLATDSDFLRKAGKDLDLLRGVISIDAGGYDLSQRNPEGLTGFFGPDPAVWAKASPVTQVSPEKSIPPFFLLHVGDGTNIGGINTEEQANLMVDALREYGFLAETVPLWDKDHASITQAVGAPGEAATSAVRTFLERVTGGR